MAAEESGTRKGEHGETTVLCRIDSITWIWIREIQINAALEQKD